MTIIYDSTSHLYFWQTTDIPKRTITFKHFSNFFVTKIHIVHIAHIIHIIAITHTKHILNLIKILTRIVQL